jgi:aspartyl protease
MEANHEETFWAHQSPRLTAIHPELLPVPSHGWNSDYTCEVDPTLNETRFPWEGNIYFYDDCIDAASVHFGFRRKCNHEARPRSGTVSYSGNERESPPHKSRVLVDNHVFQKRHWNDVPLPTFTMESPRKSPRKQDAPDLLHALASAALSLQPLLRNLPWRQKLRRFDLPLLFRSETEAIEIMACPDSGSDENIMSEDLVKALGLRIQRAAEDKKQFSLANGKTVGAVGRVTTRFSFASGSSRASPPECIFYVFSSLAVPVIMGMEFLKQTETLTKHTDRMTEQTMPTMQALRVNSLGKAKQNLVCRLGPYTGLASTDTGSDIDLVSPKFAGSRAFNILPMRETIQFADCSSGYTSGIIRAAFCVGRLDDCEGFIPSSITQVLDFHVLDNLTADILLGQQTIRCLDVFNNHADSIVPSMPRLGESDVNIIRHIGAFEAFCSRKWREMKSKDQNKSLVPVIGMWFDVYAVFININATCWLASIKN